MRSESYAAGGAREERWEETSIATKDGTIVTTANSMICGALTTAMTTGRFPIPVAQTAHAVLPPRVEALDSKGWVWRSGSAATSSAISTMSGENRRTICNVNSYHEIGDPIPIFR